VVHIDGTRAFEARFAHLAQEAADMAQQCVAALKVSRRVGVDTVVCPGLLE
jgi:hypothetical protein